MILMHKIEFLGIYTETHKVDKLYNLVSNIQFLAQQFRCLVYLFLSLAIH
jgi:hypothetical protein